MSPTHVTCSIYELGKGLVAVTGWCLLLVTFKQ